MADRVGVLNKGRLIQQGRPQEIYNDPRDTFVASFVGSPAINLLDGYIENGTARLSDFVSLPLAPMRTENSSTHGGHLTFGIRPEDIRLETGEAATAQVHEVENQGVEQIVTLRAGDMQLRATAPARMRLALEEEIRFGWNPAKVLLFDAKSGRNLAHGETD